MVRSVRILLSEGLCRFEGPAGSVVLAEGRICRRVGWSRVSRGTEEGSSGSRGWRSGVPGSGWGGRMEEGFRSPNMASADQDPTAEGGLCSLSMMSLTEDRNWGCGCCRLALPGGLGLSDGGAHTGSRGLARRTLRRVARVCGQGRSADETRHGARGRRAEARARGYAVGTVRYGTGSC